MVGWIPPDLYVSALREETKAGARDGYLCPQRVASHRTPFKYTTRFPPKAKSHADNTDRDESCPGCRSQRIMSIKPIATIHVGVAALLLKLQLHMHA